MDLRDIIQKLEKAKGFMLSVSIPTEDGKRIENFLMTEQFNPLDMLVCHHEIKSLIINELETKKFEPTDGDRMKLIQETTPNEM